jgi:hypothetical protein
MNANDSRRDQILGFLYQRHQTTKGITAIPIGILELRREMKARYGMKQPEVASNLDYLIQVGNQGVTVVGDKNVVHASINEFAHALDQLNSPILVS